MFPEETHRRAGAGEGARHRSASGKMQTEAPGRRRPRPAERLFPKQAGTLRARRGSGESVRFSGSRAGVVRALHEAAAHRAAGGASAEGRWAVTSNAPKSGTCCSPGLVTGREQRSQAQGGRDLGSRTGR